MALIANSQKPNREPLWVTKDDVYRTPVAQRIFVFNCGCGGGIKERTNAVLHALGQPTMERIKISASPTAQRYVSTNNLDKICPALAKHTYAVLHNPATGALLDLMSADLDTIIAKAHKVVGGKL